MWGYAATFAAGLFISALLSFLFAKYLNDKTAKQMIFDIMFKYKQTKFKHGLDYTFSFTAAPEIRPSTECIAFDAIVREARRKNVPDTHTTSKALNAVQPIRKAMKDWASIVHYPPFIPIQKITICKNIHDHELNACLLQYPGCSLDNGIVIYLFGGGFFSGDVRDGYPMLAIMQQYLGCYGFALDYGLCPQLSVPQIIDEGVAAYKYVIQTMKVDVDKIFIVGDSSGGAFCLLLLQKLNELGLEQPCGAILLSPIVDLSWTIALDAQEVGDVDGTKYTFDAQQIKNIYVAVCMDEDDRKEYEYDNDNVDVIMSLPKYSPINGDFKGLCPLYVNASCEELLFNDAETLVEKCKECGVDVTYEWDECLPHSTALRCDMIPECRDRLIIIVQWMKKQLKRCEI